MAIPLQMQLLWRAMTAASNGSSPLRAPVDQLPAAREKRKKLMSLPGASLVVGKPHPDVLITTKSVAGYDGAIIPARVYRPAGTADRVLPLILNYHGGGWVMGDPEQSGWWCSSVSHGAQAVVVSIDYRLAPEHPYPVPVEDCYAATGWAIEHAADLGADGSRMAVMGDSAGGNIAAVVCLMTRDRGGPPIRFQLLLYPAVDLVNSYPSEDENEFAPILGKADLGVSRAYCTPEQKPQPYVSPLFADHTGLPPALILTAQHDPIRDQGTAYAKALREAGVDVRLTNYVDAVHGFISLPGAVPAARQASAEAVSALTEALTPPVP